MSEIRRRPEHVELLERVHHMIQGSRLFENVAYVLVVVPVPEGNPAIASNMPEADRPRLLQAGLDLIKPTSIVLTGRA